MVFLVILLTIIVYCFFLMWEYEKEQIRLYTALNDALDELIKLL